MPYEIINVMVLPLVSAGFTPQLKDLHPAKDQLDTAHPSFSWGTSPLPENCCGTTVIRIFSKMQRACV